MRVLYVSHTSTISGGERSLLELIPALQGRIEPVIACPAGQAADEFRELGLPVYDIPGTTASLSLHPYHTPHGIAELLEMAMGIRRVVRAVRPNVLHANSIRAGLAAVAAAPGDGVVSVIHLRDCMPDTTTTRLVRQILLRVRGALIANSQYTAAHFAPDGSAKMYTVGNAVNPYRFSPIRARPAPVRSEFGIEPDAPLLGVVAQITPWKAQDDAIKALAELHRTHPAARLMLVGEPKFVSPSTRFDNIAFLWSLRALAHRLGVAHAVHFLGDRDDIPDILHSLDLVLLPSWQEPFGRSVIEAMAMQRVVIATSVGGPAEILSNGLDGYLLPPRAPTRWALLASELLADRVRLQSVGTHGRDTILARFTPEHVACDTCEVYGKALMNNPRRPRGRAKSRTCRSGRISPHDTTER